MYCIGADQLFLKNRHKIQQIFRLSAANVIDGVRRKRQTVLSISFLRRAPYHPDNTLDNIVNNK